MAIALKTFKGGNVTPQDDAIIYQTVLPGAGVFKGCEVSFARSNVLHISQGFGMIKGRFFEMYETEVPVQLADTGETKLGRLYIHMDLSNTDEPVQILTETAKELSTLASDINVNYNNTTYDLELAKFKVSSTAISELTNTFKAITAGGSGGGGAVGLEREMKYSVGDTTSCSSAPGWCTLYCTQAGTTDSLEPKGYSQITKVGDKVLDGTTIFEARNTILELTQAQTDIDALETKHDTDVAALEKKISDTADEVAKQMSSTGNLVQKIMSVSDYQKLGTYDSNTMYYCYDNADTQEIKCIYLGQHVIYATGVTVTYKIDTGKTVKQTASLSNDIILSAPPAAKTGYSFVGWKNDSVADGAVLTKYVLESESPVTLYAVFKGSAKIDMDSGDATLKKGATETSQTVDMFYNNGVCATADVTMPECPYEMSADKVFCGWKTSLSSTTVYMPGENYSFSKSETLVPSFIDKEYDFLSSNYYQTFHVPADGIYEFELWGGQGGTCTGTVDNETIVAKGGKGGHVKAYRKCKKDEYLYIYNGGAGNFNANGSCSGGNNGGAYGNCYYSSSYASTRAWGAGGGGATYVADTTFSLAYNNQSTQYRDRNHILLLAGGGGGAGIASVDNTSYKATKGGHAGGYAGGERGQDGSGGVLGGRQTAVGTTDYQGFGAATPYYTGSSSVSYTYSGGGAGWFSGTSASYGASAAGGSSYVGNMPTFTHNGVKYKTLNESDINEGNGYAYVRFVMPCKVE